MLDAFRAVVTRDPHRCPLQSAGGQVFCNRNVERMRAPAQQRAPRLDR